VRSSTQWLLLGLGAALALLVYSRTRSGADALGGVVGFLDVSSERLKNAVLSHGYRNNNPGNLRANRYVGSQGVDDDGLAMFDTPQNGTRALGHQLLSYAQRGLRTVNQIISTWAPPSENDTYAYIQDVAAQLSIDPDETINVQARLPELARAIATHENGYLDDTYDFDNWVYL
jgi:hypothetical protein